MNIPRCRAAAPFVLAMMLAACAAAFGGATARAAAPAWPAPWQDETVMTASDFSPPAFDAPAANHCHRQPDTREMAGGGAEPQPRRWLERRGARADTAPAADASKAARAESEASAAPSLVAPAAPPSPAAPSATALGESRDSIAPSPWPQPQPEPKRQASRPAYEPVTAGVVDDNADFGAYLNYRQRRGGLAVRDRDVSERYLLEVSDARGRPVHDAEVAVQRPGVAEPVMWARTDTQGKVWLHPRAFLAPQNGSQQLLGVAVRKAGVQARATLRRGQAESVQVQLAGGLSTPGMQQRPRLDLVFMVDATGSMGDEINKLKTSMRAMAEQVAQLPGQPDICWGLVAYRDRGDAFITRTHDFTDDLGAFQQVLARVQAGGGGDTPEALNEALHEVVHGLSWRRDAARLVVMVADAPPHLDYGGCTTAPEAVGFSAPRGQRAEGSGRPGACPQYDRDMQAALAKGIKLFAVGASGLDPTGEYVFRQLAQYTAGRFVFLTYRNAADPGSGPGTQTVHDVQQYSVQTLDRLIVRLVTETLAPLQRS